MKKIIVSLLTVCMLFSLCSMSAFAMDGEEERVPVSVTEDSVLTVQYSDYSTNTNGTDEIKAATTLGYYELVLPYGINLETAEFDFGTDKIKFSVSEEHRTLWEVDDALLERYFNNLRVNIWENMTYCKGDSEEYDLCGGYGSVKLEDGQTYTVSLGSEHSMLPKDDNDEENSSLGNTKYVTLTGSVKFAFKVRVDGPAALEGASHTVTKGEETDVITEFDEELAKFVKVVYNGEELEKDVDYTATEGSTVITLKDSFLETLDVGAHNVYVYFEDGTSVIPVTVEAAANDEDEAPSTDTDENNKDTESTPAVDTEKGDENIGETKNEEENSSVADNEKPATDKSDENSNETKKDTSTSPKTGDTLPFAIVILALAVLIVTAVACKKVRN